MISLPNFVEEDENYMIFSRKFAMPNKWTFEMKPIRKLLNRYLFKATNVLVPFAGRTRFAGLDLPPITYIDIEPNRPQPYLLGDCLEIMPTLPDASYDLIISDPPFCFFQCVHMYGNEQLQDITACRRQYDRLLAPTGIVIQLGFNSTGMSDQRGYEMTELLLVNQGGSHSDIIITVERRYVPPENQRHLEL